MRDKRAWPSRRSRDGRLHGSVPEELQGGGTVAGLAVLMELSFLPGRDKVGDLPLTVLHTV